MAARKKRFRADFRKNRSDRTRSSDWTRQYQSEALDDDAVVRDERISGKGELTRKRTVRTVGDATAANVEPAMLLDVDADQCLSGRVLSVHGLTSQVDTPAGVLQCTTRGLLRTLSTDQRHVVAAGDRVLLNPTSDGEGVIERVEPRQGVLSRAVRGKRHVIVANVELLIIVASADDPPLKPNLIDRFLVSAEQSRIPPLVCINKIDLVDPAELQPLVGAYSQMGYDVVLVSAARGLGVDRLRRLMHGRQSVVAGQSGVGKSSLLNGVEPGLALRVGTVSKETRKGKHTTTTARLLPLSGGGYVVDTPGIRQFQLWDVIGAEVHGLCRDLRPFVNRCRFPDCTHSHEQDCAVKDAVADGWLDLRRYESAQHMQEEDDGLEFD